MLASLSAGAQQTVPNPVGDEICVVADDGSHGVSGPPHAVGVEARDWGVNSLRCAQGSLRGRADLVRTLPGTCLGCVSRDFFFSLKLPVAYTGSPRGVQVAQAHA